jgi:hypothetical protein
MSEIEFVNPNDDYEYYKYRSKASSWAGSRDTPAKFNTDAIANALRALQRDSLDLKKYRHLLHDILITRDGLKAWVQFGYSGHNTWQPAVHNERTFSITNRGRTLSFQPSDPIELMTSPKHIKNRILESVTITAGYPDCTPQNATFDLDRKITVGAIPILASVSQELRYQHESQFCTCNEVSVKMRSNISSTNFDHFDKLRRFCCIASTPQEPCEIGNRGQSMRNMEFLL